MGLGKAEAWNFLWVSPMGNKDPNTAAIACDLSAVHGQVSELNMEPRLGVHVPRYELQARKLHIHHCARFLNGLNRGWGYGVWSDISKVDT